MQQFFEKVKYKSKEIFFINILIFLPMWSIFIINQYLLGGILNHFGIHPRDFSLLSGVAVMTSWLLHGNYAHIIGNSSVLFPLLFMICLLEKNPSRHIGTLILVSGAFTWLLGMPHSNHIGASGLVFALFGYILSSLVLGRNFMYFIPVAVVGYFYWQSILYGLIPQEGVSLAAHLGGVIGGIIVGAFIHKKDETPYRALYKKTFKEKYDSWIWDIKYKFNKNKWK